MSYMESKSSVTSFSECIISFWFRIPGESMAAIPYDNKADPEPVFNGVLPLLVMGEEGREEGKYDGNGEPALWMTIDFKSQGPFYDYYATYLGEECTSWHDFTFIYDFHCCLIGLRRTLYTAYKIGDGEDFHDEQYRPVYSPEPHEEQKSNPTFIGVTDDGHLIVNFQTNKQPKITGDEGYEYVTSITPGESIGTSGNIGYMEGMQTTTVYYDGGLLGCVGLVSTASTEGPTIHPGIDGTGHYKAPEEHKTSFPPLPYETGKFFSNSYETGWDNKIKVSPDRWHHVLVSVKLQTTKSHNVTGDEDYGYEGGSLLYIALDNKNYTKEGLSDMWGWGGEEGKMGENEVFPDQCWDIATDYYNPERGPPMTYELNDPQVPSGTIGIPAIDKYIDNIKRVEMAELQIWFGQSFDTGDAANRQLFITLAGKPEKPEVAEEALGKPDVLVHGSSNWKQGINKGALGPGDDPDRPIEPWFSVTPEEDGIVRWKPDPSLRGPQSPAPPQGET